jgi:hypothetical protein
MKKGFLSDYFEAVAAKRLSDVEADALKSNQHEFNGISEFKEILGTTKKTFDSSLIYLSDEDDFVKSSCNLTWYDARENHPTRTEYRLYYQSAFSLEYAEAGDLLVLCKCKTDNLVVFIAENGSTKESQLVWLFNLNTEKLFQKLDIKQIEENSKSELSYLSNLILEEIGIDISDNLVEDKYLETIKQQFPKGFPTTRIFSAFARKSSMVQDSSSDPDNTIIHWMEHEEILFRTFEKFLLEEKISRRFSDVEDFISFSLSVQNRRKSRAGKAFENHMFQIFMDSKVRFSFNQKTELKSRPDFIFPGIKEYFDSAYPVDSLYMLAAKKSCKDRWRQVLAEAHRIPRKHLITLEPGISQDQTDEMISKNLQLVLPKGIFPSYTGKQQSYLMTLGNFIGLVKSVS